MNVKLITIAHLIGAEIPRDAEDIEIRGVASLEDAGSHEVSFLSNPRYRQYLASTGAAAVIVSKDTVVSESVVPLYVDSPYFALVRILELFNYRTQADIASGIDPSARIHPDAVLGKNTAVGSCAVIGQGVTVGDGTVIGSCSVVLKDSAIGKDCIIYPNVSIMDKCEIGDRVILHSGVVVGSDGFGFVPHEGKFYKIPQIGCVRIGDDVEVQAGSCIDRGAFGDTVIGNGTKLDNLVQVAHNVRIGSNCVLVSQSGVAGSSTVGSGVKIGGQAGIVGHLNIGDGASVGGKSGVTKDVSAGDTVSGFPARKHSQIMRQDAAMRKLPELIKKVKAQEEKIKELERIIKERS
jgi:UDP-3-O-[3-hydroxymyristoyl] glucosamine N-acyltransferase